MKRIISLFIVCLLIFSLCSCKTLVPQPDSGGSTPTVNENNTPGGSSDTTDTTTPTSPPSTGGSEDSGTSGGNTASQGGGNSGGGEASGGGTATPPPPINSGTEIVSHHTPLSRDEYYQYSHLSAQQKQLYNAMYSAAELGVNDIDVKKLSRTRNDVVKVYKAFTADNPQFFYISKHYSYTISESDSTILNFTLYYSDGVNEDDFDDNGNRISTANRAAISRQKAEFDKKIGEILASIPSDVRKVEIERLIYDYVCDNVTYDDETADKVKSGTDTVTHSFDAYGAACKSLAVCEGYAKLFQYLCYRTGINSTQVLGAEGTYHMWNAIQIDGKWYFVDTTWDDSEEKGFNFYRYFNVTAASVADNHPADSSVLTVPECTATDAAFYNVFALCTNGNDLPSNYKEIIDLTYNYSGRFLCIYRTEESLDLSRFIDLQIRSPRSPIRQYIAEKGYPMTIGECRFIDTYYYIKLF